MRILVTGVAGFIGSNLADRLLNSSDYEVVGIDNLSYGVMEQVPDRVEFHQVDVRSSEIYSLFEGIDAVFHLAAKNCISDCQANPMETADINVMGTVNVFEAARRAGVRKVIYAESSAMYEGSDVFPTPESQVRPESFYAVSKTASMEFARAYERFSGICFTALRYFCVYGPRQDYRRTIPPVMSAFIIKLLNGEAPVIYGTGEKRRDFVYVDDVNDFHLLCLQDERTSGRVFNIGSGRNYSVMDIYKLLSELMEVDILPVHKSDLPGEARETLADINEARQVGWQPKTAIDDGLRKMIGYIRSELEKGIVLQ